MQGKNTRRKFGCFLFAAAGIFFWDPVSADSPVAVNDTTGICNAMEAVTVNVLANDHDPDGDPIHLSDIIIEPLYGEVITDSTGNITYIPTIFFTGSDVLLYQICDNTGACSVASLTIFSQSISGCVWPGDANDNNLSNYQDLLPIGLYYGMSGPPRYDPGAFWEASYCHDWETEGEFTDLPNGKFADCNGDGTVNAADTTVLLHNYGLQHDTSISVFSYGGIVDPPFYVHFYTDSLVAGTGGTFPVILGNSSIPAQNIYGVAFTVSYDKDLIVPGSMHASFNESWLGTPGDDLIFIQHDDTANGLLEISATRINHIARFGSGTAATLEFVMEDNVAGKLNGTVAVTMVICIQDPLAVDASGNHIPLQVLCDSVVVYENSTDIFNPGHLHLALYPNPASGHIVFDNPDALEGILLFRNISGQTISRMKIPAGQTKQDIPVAAYPAGTYMVTFQTSESMYTQKLIIQH